MAGEGLGQRGRSSALGRQLGGLRFPCKGDGLCPPPRPRAYLRLAQLGKMVRRERKVASVRPTFQRLKEEQRVRDPTPGGGRSPFCSTG